MPNKPQKIIVHHDGASRSGPSFDVINAYHKGLGWPASRLGFHVGYHFVIEREGGMREAREADEIGAHTKGENDRSIGICLAGNFDLEMPTTAQVKKLGALLASLVALHKIPETEIYPHRKFAVKSCYGKLLDDRWAREVLADYNASLVKPAVDSPADVVKDVISKLQGVLPKIS